MSYGKRTNVATSDPEIGPNPNPGGGQRNEVRLSMGERIRQQEALKGHNMTDPEVIKAKALVEASGAITKVDAQQLRLTRQQEKQQKKHDDLMAALQRGQVDQRAANIERSRAAAERAIMAAGGQPTKEAMALLGFDESSERVLPDNLTTNKRKSQMPLQVRDDTQMPAQTTDGIAERVMEELSKERAAKSQQESQMSFEQAKAVLEAAGMEIVEPEPEKPKAKPKAKPKLKKADPKAESEAAG